MGNPQRRLQFTHLKSTIALSPPIHLCPGSYNITYIIRRRSRRSFKALCYFACTFKHCIDEPKVFPADKVLFLVRKRAFIVRAAAGAVGNSVQPRLTPNMLRHTHACNTILLLLYHTCNSYVVYAIPPVTHSCNTILL